MPRSRVLAVLASVALLVAGGVGVAAALRAPAEDELGGAVVVTPAPAPSGSPSAEPTPTPTPTESGPAVVLPDDPVDHGGDRPDDDGSSGSGSDDGGGGDDGSGDDGSGGSGSGDGDDD